MMIDFFQLTEKEKIMKKIYENEGGTFLTTPMTYGDYNKLIEEYPDFLDIRKYLESKSENNLGSTVSIADWNEINVVVHERYGYPLLHNHTYIEIAYVFSGQCTHFVENESFLMREGDLCVLSPNSMHTIVATSDDSVIINILFSKELFNSSFLQMMKEKHILTNFFQDVLFRKIVSPYIIFPTGKDKKIHEIIYNMHIENELKEYAYKESLELYVKQLFIHIIRKYEDLAIVSDPIENIKENNLISILAYISANYSQVSLKDVAKSFNYNEGYLGRLIKKYTGKTFATIISEIQMSHAKQLIEDTSMSLTEISQEIGCFDLSHFNRKFKKIYGKSPDEYRKDIRN